MNSVQYHRAAMQMHVVTQSEFRTRLTASEALPACLPASLHASTAARARPIASPRPPKGFCLRKRNRVIEG